MHRLLTGSIVGIFMCLVTLLEIAMLPAYNVTRNGGQLLLMYNDYCRFSFDWTLAIFIL